MGPLPSRNNGHSVRAFAAAGVGGTEPATEADVCRPQPTRPCNGSRSGKKVLSLDQKREAVTHLVEAESIPAVVACDLIDLPRSIWYYGSLKVTNPEDRVIEDFLRDCVARRPRRGFGKCFARFRRMGYGRNHKRVYRIYKQLGVNLRRPVKLRLPERVKQPLVAPLSPNAGWSMDFMSDRLTNG
jgi:putative transposase